jgi:3-oxoacyl-(acyl-carrier-protein) synthase
MEIGITSYCRIKNESIVVNGKELPITKQNSPAFFMAEAYKHLGLNYPKFHKMDALCKLGLLATEAALQNTNFLTKNSPENIGILLANNSSSLDTDRHHQQSINDKNSYLPSPSVFVYTLPNIVIGELAIKHKITGENAFFVSNGFDANILLTQNQVLLKQNQVSAVISGWVDYDNGHMDALIYLAEIADDSIKNTNFIALNESTLNQLYV